MTDLGRANAEVKFIALAKAYAADANTAPSLRMLCNDYLTLRAERHGLQERIKFTADYETLKFKLAEVSSPARQLDLEPIKVRLLHPRYTDLEGSRLLTTADEYTIGELVAEIERLRAEVSSPARPQPMTPKDCQQLADGTGIALTALDGTVYTPAASPVRPQLADLVLKPLLVQLKWAVSHDPNPDQMTRNIAEFTAEAEKGLAALAEGAVSTAPPALTPPPEA